MNANRIVANRISVVHKGYIRDMEQLDEYYRLMREGMILVSEERALTARR